MSIRIEKYNTDYSTSWNTFIAEAKNSLFLFDRGYMEYHADRFTDHSLLFFNGDELLAVLPATQQGDILNSHAGLTYGGFVLHKRAGAGFVLACVDALVAYLKEQGIQTLVYKAIPAIYHQLPAQEDLYALFRKGAVLYRRDISSVLDLSNKPAYTKGTKYNLSKARKNALQVAESTDFRTFMTIEEELLRTKYGTKPTHSHEEISMLAGRFPDNIKLYLVFKEDACLGGTITYQTSTVVHTQYIGITDEGKEIGALDTVTDYLIQHYSSTHRYFSFGISTTHEGRELNEGLIRNKESFGARAVVHDFYQLQID
jgi:hypothetical protein